jgi:MFS family permease
MGAVVGLFSAIFFTEWLGRKGTMIFGLIISLVGLATINIYSQTAAIVGVFFYGAGMNIAFSSIFTFITEFFSE